MTNPYEVHLAPQLYELAYEQLAKPQGITVEQAVNRLVAVAMEPCCRKDLAGREDNP